MTGHFGRGAAAISLLALLAACGSGQSDGPSALSMTRQALGQIVAERGAGSAPAAPAVTPQQMAAEALAVNPNPLILVGLESAGTTQVLAMVGENGGMRTYMTSNEQGLILRGGMLTGTRGLGNDISVVEASGSAALIRAGRSGTAQRVIRYYSGDGLERPLPFTCTIGPGPRAGVMVEDCEGNGISFQNSYLPSGGAIPVSRQWAGPGLGYITIQTIRP